MIGLAEEADRTSDYYVNAPQELKDAFEESISDGKEMSRTDVVIVGIIVIGILGILCDYIFSILVKKVNKGKSVEAYE